MSYYHPALRRHGTQSEAEMRRTLESQQDELDRLREQADRERERQERAERERREEREQRYEEAKRTARDWPDAFRKNHTLYTHELAHSRAFAAEQAKDPEGDPFWKQHAASDTTFWEDAIAEIDAAERIWREQTAVYAPEIDALRQQIAVVEQAMRQSVIDRVEAERGPSKTDLRAALEANDPDAWLNW